MCRFPRAPTTILHPQPRPIARLVYPYTPEMPSVQQASVAVAVQEGEEEVVPQISLRDFETRREEIKQQLIDAASNIGFL